MKYYVSLILSMVILFSCKKENKNPNSTLPVVDTVMKDISYGENPAMVFDLYLPAGRNKNTKLIILIHGGGWNAGDKAELNFFGQAWKEKGFAVANINYRLSPQMIDNYKMQLDDIDQFIQYISQRESYYSFGSSYYIIGHSAGAHLSLSYAYTRNGQRKIKAAGGMATPTNLIDGAGSLLTNQLITEYLGVPLNPNTEQRYKDCSPFFQATLSSVPTILFQGEWDIIVPQNQSINLAAKLSELGVPNKLILYPAIFHDWWSNGNLVNNTVDETASWFHQH